MHKYQCVEQNALGLDLMHNWLFHSTLASEYEAAGLIEQSQ